MNLDPRIGMLNNGKCYAFVHGYSRPETIGTLDEIERALGSRPRLPPATPTMGGPAHDYLVTLRFEHPAWDETDGIPFVVERAASRQDAIKQARRRAQSDGHIPCRGKGRYWFASDVLDDDCD